MAILILLAIFLITLVVMAWWHNQYWKRRGIKGPPLVPFLGVLDRLGDPKHPNVFKYNEWSKIYGKYYGIQKGRQNVLITSDAEMVHEMLTTKFELFHERERNPILGNPDTRERTHTFHARGKRWKRLRTLSNPVFAVQNLKKIFPVLDDSALETVRLLRKASSEKDEIDIHPFMHEYTMDTIARIALGQVESKQFNNEYTKLLVDSLNGGSWLINSAAAVYPPLGPIFWQRLGMLRSRLKGKGIAMLLKSVYKAVHDRKAARTAGEIDEESVNFIDFFLDAESDSVEQEITGIYDKSNVHVSKKLTTEEVVAQCNLFLFAGFDTTANTLSLTAFYLAKNPSVQEKLKKEIEDNCVDSSVSYEDLNKLKYCEAVMKEVLRLHPIAAMALNRTAATTTKLGNVTIEEGTCVHVDVIGLHYAKEIWGQDVDEFVPERWLKEKVPNAFYPFGGGPRICVGMRLAYIEEKLALVHILRQFKILETPNTGDKPIMFSNAVLNPEHITVKLEEIS